jgi:hypothetical protein
MIKLLKKIMLRFRQSRSRLYDYQYNNLSNFKIFKNIYDHKIWTPDNKKKTYKYYSGLGSYDRNFVDRYVLEVKKYLKKFYKKPKVVDLGCGDFNVGSKIRPFCNSYTAIDIYDKLIIDNKEKFKNLNVKFLNMDFTKYAPPKADVCFLRCVLQHLSNKSILEFLRIIKNKFKIIILTEHLPNENYFIPNIDIKTGPNIRLHKNSGVDLTKEPFNLKVKNQVEICNIRSKKIIGVLKTTVLEIE